MAMPYEKDTLTDQVIGCAIEVHRHLGPGLLESAYEECLCYELKQNGLGIRRQVPLPVVYKSVRLDCGYRMDVVVDNRLILELKAAERLLPIHEAQVITIYAIERDADGPPSEFQYTGTEGRNPGRARNRDPGRACLARPPSRLVTIKRVSTPSRPGLDAGDDALDTIPACRAPS